MPAPNLKDLAIGDLEHELATTRTALEKIPEDDLAWKPAEKSFTLAGLGGHIANLPLWMSMTFSEDGFDLAQAPPSMEDPKSRAEILATFDGHVEALRKIVAGATEATLAQEWTLRNGAEVIWSQPKAAVFRSFGISHLVHHRAQLGVYLRLLGQPVPSSYGPTADDDGGFGG